MISKHDSIAEVYEKIRPTYPEQLINQIVTYVHCDSANILEIGAGTGKATQLFLNRPHKIDCIEPGKQLANFLMEKCKANKNVKIFTESFESWQPEANKQYDLIFSAQAFHWIDPSVKFEKTNRLLKANGSLALFWYQPVPLKDDISKMIQSIILKHCPNYYNDIESGESLEETRERRKSELIQSNLFSHIKTYEYTTENSLTTEAYICALQSYSKFAGLESAVKEYIIKDLKAMFSEQNIVCLPSNLHYYLFTAQKLSV